MARHAMAIFALVTTVLALVPADVAHSQSSSSLPTVTISVQNNFTTYNLTVVCGSDVPRVVHPEELLPQKAYTFQFDPRVEHLWACDLSTAKPGHFCSARYRGEFIVWQSSDLAATAPVLCSTNCQWFADERGLSLIQHPRGEPVHIYDWSNDACYR